MREAPRNTDDVIDSRDVIARIEELEDERDALEGVKETVLWDRENADELTALKALAEQGEQYAADWLHGETLIRESYFETYAEELAADVCAYDSREARWPLTHIDWEAAAEELKQDYTEIDFDGVPYLIR